MELEYLGQAGFILSSAEEKYLIDPYLSNYVVSSGIGEAKFFSRAFPPPVAAKTINNVKAIFVTHDHADHCDPETILPVLVNNPGCLVVGPQPALDHLRHEGVNEDRLWLAPVTEWNEINGVRFTSLPSAHYQLDQDERTGNYPYLGFVLNLEGRMIYHSGDTILYDGLEDRLLEISGSYDICCLPVNGRDAEREALGIVGNLQPEEALWLADKLKAEVLIPTHNDLFEINHLDPSRLEEHRKNLYPNQAVKWMQPGEFFVL